MIALIIAQGVSPGMETLNERHPSPMLPLVDRPFIQHVVEFLVEGGITQFQFVLSHLPRKIESFLGDGSRWGSAFRYHLARDPMHPYDILKAVRLGEDAGPLLLVHADRLPQVDLAQTGRRLGLWNRSSSSRVQNGTIAVQPPRTWMNETGPDGRGSRPGFWRPCQET